MPAHLDGPRPIRARAKVHDPGVGSFTDAEHVREERSRLEVHYFRDFWLGVMPAQCEATLPHTKDAPRMARRSLRQWMGLALSEPELDDAELLVTELVTNAVCHGRGSITLRARLDADRLVIEVIDEGEGFEREVRQHDLPGVGGRGLGIVDTVASRWGIHEGTTHVWFELERPGPRLGATKNPLS